MDHIIRKRTETEFQPNSMNRKDDIVLNRSWRPLIYTKRNGGGIISIHTRIMMPPPSFPCFTSYGSFHSFAPVTFLVECPVTLFATVFGTSLTSFADCTLKPLQTHLTPLFLLAHILHIY
jgi:hypothetical protein